MIASGCYPEILLIQIIQITQYLDFPHDNTICQTALFITEIMHTGFCLQKKVRGLQKRNNWQSQTFKEFV